MDKEKEVKEEVKVMEVNGGMFLEKPETVDPTEKNKDNVVVGGGGEKEEEK